MPNVDYGALGEEGLRQWNIITSICSVTLTKSNFWQWITHMNAQSENFDWGDILTIQTGNAPNLQDIDLINNFNSITIEEVMAD